MNSRLILACALLAFTATPTTVSSEITDTEEDQLAIESGIREESIVTVAALGQDPSTTSQNYQSISNINEFIRQLVQQEVKNALANLKVNPFPPTHNYQANYPAWSPYYQDPYRVQANPYYGPYNPYRPHPNPYYDSEQFGRYHPYPCPTVQPKTPSSHEEDGDFGGVQARRPFPSRGDASATDEDAMKMLDAIKDEDNLSDVEGRKLISSILVASDLSSVTIKTGSFLSLLRSLNSLATLSVTTKTVLVPGVSLG